MSSCSCTTSNVPIHLSQYNILHLSYQLQQSSSWLEFTQVTHPLRHSKSTNNPTNRLHNALKSFTSSKEITIQVHTQSEFVGRQWLNHHIGKVIITTYFDPYTKLIHHGTLKSPTPTTNGLNFSYFISRLKECIHPFAVKQSFYLRTFVWFIEKNERPS